MSKPIVLPKFYNYTVEGVLDKNDNPRKFSIASLSRDIYDDFDTDCLAGSAALDFYLKHPKYQDDSLWPLVFKFTGSQNPVEVEMNLYHTPTFLSTPRPVEVKVESVPEEDEPVVEKKERKTRTRKVSTAEVIDIA